MKVSLTRKSIYLPVDNHENAPREPTVSPPQASVSSEDLGTLYEQHFPEITRYIGRIIGNGNESSDLAQDTFENAFKALNGGNSPGGPKPLRLNGARSWLFRIARNQAIDYLRRQDRMRTEPIDGYTDNEEQDGYTHNNWHNVRSTLAAPHEPIEETVARRMTLQDIFAALPPKVAQTLYLAYVEGYGRAEIAALEGVSESAIKQRAIREIGATQITDLPEEGGRPR